MSATILIVDDEENARRTISSFLAPKGYEVLGVATLAEAREHLQRGDADLVLLDVQLPDGYGPTLLEENNRLPHRIPIILITAYGDIEMAVDAMKNGAHDFLQKPIQLARLEQSITRAQEVIAMRRELTHLRNTQRKASMDFVTGSSESMKRLFEQARRASQASVSVLVTGETGSGKEVLARYVHSSGPRSEKPFIAVNCAAIQSTMLESELFGYEAGAFTGAEKRKPGLLEVADGGILFLDEISSMPIDIQAKLLRVLEERAFRRVGGTNLIKVDVQILAASNRPLTRMMADGAFREDLYYRLKVVDLHIPPLRERKGDILEMAGYFVRQNNMRMGMNITDITPQAVDVLRAYPWPGNVRELRNAIERAMLFCDEQVIDISHLPIEVGQTPAER
jgi:DNA-binding NtrC family response regulator